MFITSQNELRAFVQRAESSSVLAIDTEFLREKTYYARLCLLQMQTDSETAIIDPFECYDLSILVPLFENKSIVKLFHAGKQDLEIIFHECGVVPHPLFDTQVAATLLGHTQQIGYGPLVSALCGVNLKKMDSFTDWSRRPLRESQIDYAADDVIYLPEMYRKMTEKLKGLNRLHWLDSDFRAMEDPSTYVIVPEERFRRLKKVNQLNAKQLAGAREMATWRELRAQKCDIPRKWVLTDEQIVEACKREAQSIDELFMVRGISDRLSIKDARELVGCLRKAFELPEEEWPQLENQCKSEVNVDAVVDLMTALVRLRARENNIAFQTLANQKELTDLARGHSDVDLLKGWRREIVGEELLALLRGDIRLRVDGHKLIVDKRHRGNKK